MSQFNTFIATLRENGLSNTQPRRAVFDFLHKNGPSSMTQIVAATRPIMNRSSVYRTVATLEELLLVKRTPHGFSFYFELGEMFSEHHHHLLCRSCSVRVDLYGNAKLEQLIRFVARSHGFSHEAHSLEIAGECPSCREKKDTL